MLFGYSTGLDHNKEMVFEHCKKLMLNLMLLAANQDCPEVARMLLSYQTNLDDTLHVISDSKDTSASEPSNQSKCWNNQRHYVTKVVPINEKKCLTQRK